MVPVMAKTFEQVKKEFFNTGTSIADWSRENNFSPGLVYWVITNKRLPKRGESHKIAVKLGLIDQKQSTDVKKQKLSYVGLSVIECFEEAGLDDVYINEKIEEFSELKNYTSLHKALRILDDGHMARLAKKLEVSVDMLNATLAVLNKI